MEMKELCDLHRDVLVLIQDLSTAKAQIDSDPAVRLSRRLQGSIARCYELSSRLTELEKKYNGSDIATKDTVDPQDGT